MNDESTSEIVIEVMLIRYFKLCRQENIGKTEKLTRRIDSLEKAIRDLKLKASR